MDEMNNNTANPSAAYLEIKALFVTLWKRRKVFYWVLPITFVLSCALILCVPRYYTCKVILAPEMQNSGSSGSLQALASTFGVDINSMSNADAIYPMIYPDVVDSPDFLTTLFDIPVTTVDNSFSGTYYDYLLTKQKAPFWTIWKSKVISWLPKKQEIQPSLPHSTDMESSILCLSKLQWKALGIMRKNITCNVDKMTSVITFSVTAQDKVICATIGESVCNAMQEFITNYRTKKTRMDIAYYEQVMIRTYQEYQEASQKYIQYVDGHSSMRQEKYRLEAHNLEIEMQLKQAAYTSFQKQYLAAEARLQENTPVFTVIQSSSIPLRPTGPKRVFFVIGMLFLALCVTSVVLCKDQLIAILF